VHKLYTYFCLGFLAFVCFHRWDPLYHMSTLVKACWREWTLTFNIRYGCISKFKNKYKNIHIYIYG